MNNKIIISETIKDKIFTIREKQVMLDSDLAELYEVSTKRLNEQVKRNKERFPEDFMFQIVDLELDSLRSQIATSNKTIIESTFGRGGRKYMPYVFTEQGIAMLSSVLKSKKAIEINIKIMRAFVNMRKFINLNAEIFKKITLIENKLLNHDEKFNEIFCALETNIPKKGIFYDGQIFDAYVFICDLIKSAKKSIVLIDNYVDESVLTLFSKRNKSVDITIYTKKVTKEFKLDLEKYNEQYARIEIKEFNKAHDRFLILDEQDVYHIGASLKDLGKKWFAFSKFKKDDLKLIEHLD